MAAARQSRKSAGCRCEWATRVDKESLSAGHNSLAYAIDKSGRLCGYDSGCDKTQGLHKFPLDRLPSIWVERDLYQGIVPGWMATARS